MAIGYNKLKVVVALSNLVDNYRLLSRDSARPVPVIKADAYGHGLVQVAAALGRAGADTFAVGTVEEGVQLRAAGQGGRVISLLGPVDDFEYQALWSADILPFIHSFEQLDRLAAHAPGAGRPLPVALKFDTGMRRLGFTPDQIPALTDRLRALSGVTPVMLSSHLATADELHGQDFAASQAQGFEGIRQALAANGFPLEANLANSAAILASPAMRYQAQRAGIALYGCNPFVGTPLEHLGAGLKPAMSVKTVVLSVHPLPAGQSISYGRTFVAPRDMTVAIVAAGYADAYSRGLTGKGCMCVAGRRAPILGRVCMQLTAVDVTDIAGVRPGDDVFLLGGQGPGRISPEDLAGWWGTITYEVFCLLGLNRREYA